LAGEYGLDIIRKARKLVPECAYHPYFLRGTVDVRSAIAEKVEDIFSRGYAEERISAIHLVGKGRTYIDPAIMQNLLTNRKKTPLSS
jgi:DNA-binding NarL/FixJ family response regulator